MLSRTGKGWYRLGWRLFELSQTLLDATAFRIEAVEQYVGHALEEYPSYEAEEERDKQANIG